MGSKRLAGELEKQQLQKAELMKKIEEVEPEIIEALRGFIALQKNKKDKPTFLSLVLNGEKLI